ncbi:class I SAM-dependent methyltransferase [uncultured Methanobrevibacter sp.]|uniref:class I SAM-dependent DNA methyltransferase n=1 Tax=uncultured Methanobrevibacter sp. TaxID=253161 RepID=UPI0025F7FAEA|nr:class I SAM-dependent methyltransferase [uncultured Methanobrevibacter sp.]
MNTELYKEFSKVYDGLNCSNYSLLMGSIVLKYLNEKHPNENFKKNLDICCGTGELCNFFMNNNIDSKGVDISEDMITVARYKFPNIEFITDDVTTYWDDEKYDFVTCFNDALNHITDVESLKSTINNISHYVRKNGLFIFDINNYNSLNYEKYSSRQIDNRELTFHFHRNNKLITCDMEYLENGEVIWCKTAFEREYYVDEIALILNNAGFVIETCSQYFYDDEEIIKWKFVTRKI